MEVLFDQGAMLLPQITLSKNTLPQPKAGSTGQPPCPT